MRHRISRRRRDTRGASAVEYGLLVAGIAAVVALAAFAFGRTLNISFQDSCATIAASTGGPDCTPKPFPSMPASPLPEAPL